jgi:hypothetical protein
MQIVKNYANTNIDADINLKMIFIFHVYTSIYDFIVETYNSFN